MGSACGAARGVRAEEEELGAKQHMGVAEDKNLSLSQFEVDVTKYRQVSVLFFKIVYACLKFCTHVLQGKTIVRQWQHLLSAIDVVIATRKYLKQCQMLFGRNIQNVIYSFCSFSILGCFLFCKFYYILHKQIQSGKVFCVNNSVINGLTHR